MSARPKAKRRTENGQAEFDAKVARRRQGEIVQSGNLRLRIVSPFTKEECDQWYKLGFQVPLDLVPDSFWWDDKYGLPRFGEEMLGDDF